MAFGSSYFFGDSHIGAGVVHYDSKYGIAGEDTFIDMTQTKEMFRSSFAVDAGALQTITVDGGYADYEHSERDPEGTPLATFKDREWETAGGWYSSRRISRSGRCFVHAGRRQCQCKYWLHRPLYLQGFGGEPGGGLPASEK